MDHSVPLITTIAAGFGLALILGFIAVRIKMPALVGYLLAGVLIGPFTPGLVADANIAKELAEIGVMLLMFGVGLHFSLNDLLEVRKIALPGAVLQIAVATAMGAGIATLWGWDLGASLVFGLALSVASTVVLLKALEGREILRSLNGRIAVGWLVVEDLAMVVALVMLPALAGTTLASTVGSTWGTLGLTFVKVSAFVGPDAGCRTDGFCQPCCGRSAQTGSTRAVHAAALSQPRSASPIAQACCSAFPSRSARFSPA